MNLSRAEEKKTYRLINVKEGKEIKLKLTAMGLYPECIVKIIKNDKSGPIIIALKASRVSIGRGLAKKIEIEEI